MDDPGERIAGQPKPPGRVCYAGRAALPGSIRPDASLGHDRARLLRITRHVLAAMLICTIEFLAGAPPMASAVAAPAVNPPGPVAAHWPPVRDFLARARGLDPALVECHVV